MNCNEKDLPVSSLFASMAQKTSDGSALRMVEVDTTGAMKYYDCSRIDVGLSLEQVFRELIGLNSDNEPALRIGKNTDCDPDNPAVTCNDKDRSTLDLARDMVYVTPVGEPFLMVCLEEL